MLEDVNLDRIEIGLDGKAVDFVFTNMVDGQSILTVKCCGVIAIQYQSSFFDGDGFGIYVGSVSVESVTQEQAQSRLTEMNYQFCREGDSNWPCKEVCHFLQIEGGEVFVSVLCKKLHAEPNMF